MFNLRISAGAAITAFVLSLLIGIFSASGILVILLRAFVLGSVVFLLALAISWLVYQFLPELVALDESSGSDLMPDGETGQPGAGIDISVGEDPGGGADPSGLIEVDDLDTGETMFPPGIGHDPAAFPAVKGSGLDQKGEDGYTDKAGGGGIPSNGAAMPDAGSVETVDDLPDLEAMPEAFVSPAGGDGADFIPPMPEGVGASESGVRWKSPKGAPAGDFSAKEVAAAIQTILKRD